MTGIVHWTWISGTGTSCGKKELVDDIEQDGELFFLTRDGHRLALEPVSPGFFRCRRNPNHLPPGSGTILWRWKSLGGAFCTKTEQATDIKRNGARVFVIRHGRVLRLQPVHDSVFSCEANPKRPIPHHAKLKKRRAQ